MGDDDMTMRDTAVKFDTPNDGPSSCPEEKDRTFIVTVNTLRTRSFKLFKRPFLGFLTILTL